MGVYVAIVAVKVVVDELLPVAVIVLVLVSVLLLVLLDEPLTVAVSKNVVVDVALPLAVDEDVLVLLADVDEVDVAVPVFVGVAVAVDEIGKEVIVSQTTVRFLGGLIIGDASPCSMKAILLTLP